MPRDLSISKPRWSFCPNCQKTIAWHDNIPVISWLVLRGRCRACGLGISLQYPVIELLTAVVFVNVFDTLLIGHAQAGATGSPVDVVPLVSFWMLFACLLACAMIDLENYIIDTRLTNAAMIIGVAANAVWALVGPRTPTLPDARICAAAMAMSIAWSVTWLVLRSRRATHTCEPPPPEESAPNATSASAVQPNAVPSVTDRAMIGLLFAAFVGLIIAATLHPSRPTDGTRSPFAIRAIATLAILCFVLILAAMQPRAADEEMIETLDSERPHARRLALSEAAWLFPTVAAGVMAFWLADRYAPHFHWGLANTHISSWAARMLAGLLTGLIGLLSGAAIGWIVRIAFTLLFGKEAMGTGDIFILAAVGAVGGFWLALIAFFIAPFLTIFGVLASLTRKSCRALPYGPWLALATLVAMWVVDPISLRVRDVAVGLWRFMTTGAFY